MCFIYSNRAVTAKIPPPRVALHHAPRLHERCFEWMMVCMSEVWRACSAFSNDPLFFSGRTKQHTLQDAFLCHHSFFVSPVIHVSLSVDVCWSLDSVLAVALSIWMLHSYTFSSSFLYFAVFPVFSTFKFKSTLIYLLLLSFCQSQTILRSTKYIEKTINIYIVKPISSNK